MDATSKVLQNILEHKDNKVKFKDLKLQNANWSYVPNHIMPMILFTWRRHIFSNHH
jgi:hypothetical protein